jgi:urease accessory protein UreE
VSIYRLHDTTGDDLGLLEHPAPNLEPGDVVVVADGREAVVTARVEPLLSGSQQSPTCRG